MTKWLSNHLSLISVLLILLSYASTFVLFLAAISDIPPEQISNFITQVFYVSVIAFLLGLIVFFINLYKIQKAKKKLGLGVFFNVVLIIPLLIIAFNLIHSQLVLPREISGNCPAESQGSTQIFYEKGSKDLVTDLTGQNPKILTENDYPNTNHRNPRSVSPDGSMLMYSWNNQLWVKCVNGNGNFQIKFPDTHRTQYENAYWGTVVLNSYPSWSPDSKKLVFNYDSDLVVFDVATRTNSILKPQVSLHDNHLNVSDPAQKNRLPQEIGDAIWLGNNTILYTAFQQSPVIVHQYEVATGKDTVLKTFDHPINFFSASPDGKWLIVRDNPWNWPYDEKIISHSGEPYLVNLDHGWQETDPFFFEYTKTDSYGTSMYWSPDSHFLAIDNSSYQNTDDSQQPAPVIPLTAKGKQDVIDIVSGVKVALQKYGVSLDRNVTIGIEGFLPNKSVVVSVREKQNFKGYILNGIYSFETGELRVLQNYSQNKSSQNNSELLPFAVIN
jgi:hypothetical protein